MGTIRRPLARPARQASMSHFDNVGGEIPTRPCCAWNPHARVAVCGWISTYNVANPRPGQPVAAGGKECHPPGFYRYWITRLFWRGHRLSWSGGCRRQAAVPGGNRRWLDNILPTFLRLFDGSNAGKLVIRIPEQG